jgi:hypothetical protein
VILCQVGNVQIAGTHLKRMSRRISALPVKKNANFWTIPAIRRIVSLKGKTNESRSYFKIRIFGRDLPPRSAGQEREAEVQPVPSLTGSPTRILKYVEDLMRDLNADIGRKDFFEMASNT